MVVLFHDSKKSKEVTSKRCLCQAPTETLMTINLISWCAIIRSNQSLDDGPVHYLLVPDLINKITMII